MSLRCNGKLFLGVLVFLVFFVSSPVSSERKDHANDDGIIHFFQKHISPVDGDRCSMYPSCSRYFKQAVVKHGWITGWIMGIDRLVRCGRDEVHLSESIWKNGKKHTYDPVENNDFWWSDK